MEEVWEAAFERGDEGIKGHCFYLGQDVESVLAGNGLMLAFGGPKDNDREGHVKAGNMIKDALESAGFPVEWNGDPGTRVHITKFDWKRRMGKGR